MLNETNFRDAQISFITMGEYRLCAGAHYKDGSISSEGSSLAVCQVHLTGPRVFNSNIKNIPAEA